jgi:hypothetical protein
MNINFSDFLAIVESKETPIVKSIKALIESAKEASQSHKGTKLEEFFNGKLEGLELALKVITEGY